MQYCEDDILQVKGVEYNRKRIRWACRRGMLELDMMLLSFFDEVYDKLSHKKKLCFVRLLGSADQDLYRWLVGLDVSDDDAFQDIVLSIRFFSKKLQNGISKS